MNKRKKIAERIMLLLIHNNNNNNSASFCFHSVPPYTVIHSICVWLLINFSIENSMSGALQQQKAGKKFIKKQIRQHPPQFSRQTKEMKHQNYLCIFLIFFIFLYSLLCTCVCVFSIFLFCLIFCFFLRSFPFHLSFCFLPYTYIYI